METLLIPWDGKLYKSNLTGGVYRLKDVKGPMALLHSVDAVTEALDGRTRIITETDNLGIFYREMDGNKIKRAVIS